MKAAFIATFLAWLAGTLFLCSSSWIIPALQGSPKGLDIESWIRVGLWAGYWVGLFVAPVCLVVVAPLLGVIPRKSILRQPRIAAWMGAFAGPTYWYGMLCCLGGSLDPLRDWSLQNLLFPACATVAGAVFGYTYARMWLADQLYRDAVMRGEILSREEIRHRKVPYGGG